LRVPFLILLEFVAVLVHFHAHLGDTIEAGWRVELFSPPGRGVRGFIGVAGQGPV
jgi:hypothetical protein